MANENEKNFHSDFMESKEGSAALSTAHDLVVGSAGLSIEASLPPADKEWESKFQSLADQIEESLKKWDQFGESADVGDNPTPQRGSAKVHITNSLCTNNYNNSMRNFTKRYFELLLAAKGGSINPIELAELQNSEKAALQRYVICLRAPKPKVKPEHGAP